MRKTLLDRKSICAKLSASKNGRFALLGNRSARTIRSARTRPELYVLVAGLVVEPFVVALVARRPVVTPEVL
jgi:hypothetical protein